MKPSEKAAGECFSYLRRWRRERSRARAAAPSYCRKSDSLWQRSQCERLLESVSIRRKTPLYTCLTCTQVEEGRGGGHTPTMPWGFQQEQGSTLWSESAGSELMFLIQASALKDWLSVLMSPKPKDSVYWQETKSTWDAKETEADWFWLNWLIDNLLINCLFMNFLQLPLLFLMMCNYLFFFALLQFLSVNSSLMTSSSSVRWCYTGVSTGDQSEPVNCFKSDPLSYSWDDSKRPEPERSWHPPVIGWDTCQSR